MAATVRTTGPPATRDSLLAKANRRPAYTLKDAMENPRRDVDRIRSLGYRVDATPGSHGGYRLAREANAISFGEVVRASTEAEYAALTAGADNTAEDISAQRTRPACGVHATSSSPPPRGTVPRR